MAVKNVVDMGEKSKDETAAVEPPELEEIKTSIQSVHGLEEKMLSKKKVLTRNS